MPTTPTRAPAGAPTREPTAGRRRARRQGWTVPLVPLVRLVALLALMALLALGFGGCGAGGAAYDVPLVGTCRGFGSRGLALGDRALLARALGTWRHEGGAMAQPVPVAPPVGPTCVVAAERRPGLSVVTLADATHLASYSESTTGVVSVETDAMPAVATHGLPLVPIAAGWLLARDVTSAQVLVSGPGLTPQSTTVPGGQGVVDVDAEVNRFAVAHPGVLPHLLVLVHAAGRLYAATGGAPYAADHRAVLVASLGPDDPRTVAGWRAVTDQPTGVVLLAQSVGFTADGGLQAPQRVDRQLTLVGVTTARRGASPVLVLRQEPDDGSHLAPEVVTVAQRSRGGADVQPAGVVTSPTGAWVGSVWLSPVEEGLTAPRELLVMGEPGTLGSRIELEASTGATGVFTAGPLEVVSGQQLPDLDTAPVRPEVTVRGRVGETEVLPLTPTS